MQNIRDEYNQERRRLEQEKDKLARAAWEYQDTLYDRYHLLGKHRILAELIPLLRVGEREKLAKVMRDARLLWAGLTDAY